MTAKTLDKNVWLKGFLGTGTLVKEYVEGYIQIGHVNLYNKLYVTDDILHNASAIIAQTFSENPNIQYHRGDGELTFKYKEQFIQPFLNIVSNSII